MAHGREGPDIVMTTRYAGVSEIRAVSVHETDRTPDGSSAIDPLRSHLNQILHGPKTQQEAVKAMWESGVKQPTTQAERPFVQMAISASPSYFAFEGGVVPGTWDQVKLDAWLEKTMHWLRKEYGADLAHVSLHLDEDTPHLHVLIIPTYEKKKGRKPSRRVKSGETEQAFADRLTAWQADTETTRTAGRSTSVYWSKKWCRRIARQSYHDAVSSLGLGYGKDFVGEDEPSPERKETGTWVREQARKVEEEKLALEAAKVQFDDERRQREAAAEDRAKLAELERSYLRKQLNDEAAALEASKTLLDDERQKLDDKAEALDDWGHSLNDRAIDLDEREERLHKLETRAERLLRRVMKVVTTLRDRLGLPPSKSVEDAISSLEAEVEDRNASYDKGLKSSAEDSGPGF